MLSESSKNLLKKVQSYLENKDFFLVKAFQDVLDKIDLSNKILDEKVELIRKENEKSKDELTEVLKKKLEEELVYEVDESSIVDSVLSKIPTPKDGKDYVLTEGDRAEIASKIKVPVVDKIIEKIEVIKEQPIITNEIREVAISDTGEEIVSKINSLEDDDTLKIDAKHIKNLPPSRVIGGSRVLSNLMDVNTTGRSDGSVLVWDEATSTWIMGTAASGSGDVVGPASSVDGDIATFDGATGKLIKDGGVKISDFVPYSNPTNNIDLYQGPPMGANMALGWRGSSLYYTYLTHSSGFKFSVDPTTLTSAVFLVDETTGAALNTDMSAITTSRTISWRDRDGVPAFVDEITGFEVLSSKNTAGGYAGLEGTISPLRFTDHPTYPPIANNQIDGIHRRAVAPTGSEDRSNGYVTNDIWITSTGIWVCTDDANGSPGAAVWTQTVGGGSGMSFAQSYSVSTLQI